MKLLLDFFFLNVNQNKRPLCSRKVAFPSYENQICLKYSPWKGLPGTHGPVFFCLSHTKENHHKRERKGRGHGSTRITPESHSQHWKELSASPGLLYQKAEFSKTLFFPVTSPAPILSTFPWILRKFHTFLRWNARPLMVPAASQKVSEAALPEPIPMRSTKPAGGQTSGHGSHAPLLAPPAPAPPTPETGGASDPRRAAAGQGPASLVLCPRPVSPVPVLPYRALTALPPLPHGRSRPGRRRLPIGCRSRAAGRSANQRYRNVLGKLWRLSKGAGGRCRSRSHSYSHYHSYSHLHSYSHSHSHSCSRPSSASLTRHLPSMFNDLQSHAQGSASSEVLSV